MLILDVQSSTCIRHRTANAPTFLMMFAAYRVYWSRKINSARADIILVLANKRRATERTAPSTTLFTSESIHQLLHLCLSLASTTHLPSDLVCVSGFTSWAIQAKQRAGSRATDCTDMPDDRRPLIKSDQMPIHGNPVMAEWLLWKAS